MRNNGAISPFVVPALYIHIYKLLANNENKEETQDKE